MLKCKNHEFFSGTVHKSRDGKISTYPPYWLTNKNPDWFIQHYQLINALFSSLYTASYSIRDFLYWRIQLRKSKLSITENNISSKCVDVKTISWFLDICLERWSKFGFEIPGQMQLNSLVNHKKLMSSNPGLRREDTKS